MPALWNPRHERFAALVAGGMTITQAYLAAGFSGKGAAQSASRLVRVAAVANRVAELRNSVNGVACRAEQLSQQMVVTKERVLHRLDHLSRLAEERGRLSAAIRCEHLIGLEMGMFAPQVDREPKWDGDLNKLDAGQLEKVKLCMEEKHYGDDKERMEREKAAYEAEWIAQHADKEDLLQ